MNLTPEQEAKCREAFDRDHDHLRSHVCADYWNGTMGGLYRQAWESCLAAGLEVVPQVSTLNKGMEQLLLHFVLRLDAINDLQLKTMRRVIKRSRNAHMADIVLRVNGADQHFEADWLQHLREVTPGDVATPTGNAAEEAACVHLCLDDRRVPRTDAGGKTLSLWGRVCEYQRMYAPSVKMSGESPSTVGLDALLPCSKCGGTPTTLIAGGICDPAYWWVCSACGNKHPKPARTYAGAWDKWQRHMRSNPSHTLDEAAKQGGKGG